MKVIENAGRLIWAVYALNSQGSCWIRAYDDEQTARDDVAQLMENPPPGRSYAVECVRLYDQASPVPSLRDYFAEHATADDISLPSTIKDIEAWLGLNPGEYNYLIHFPHAVAKARYVFADAMLSARKVPA